MKRKVFSLISLLVVSAGVGANNFYVSSNVVDNATKKKNSTEIVEKEKQKENKSVEKEQEEETVTSEEEKSTETVEEIIEENNSTSSSSSNSSISSSYSSNNNKTNTTKRNSSNSVVNNYTPPHVQTEWEKLGISEYAYYNTAPPNEGEIAKDITNCDAKADEINIKYGLVTHSGDVRSYSEKYIGCWITIHFNDGRRMFYNEFNARENRGEFNYLLTP